MIDLRTHDADLRAIASAYREQREAGAVDHTAFTAALVSYRLRHPHVSRGEAALIVCQLVDDLLQGPVTEH